MAASAVNSLPIFSHGVCRLVNERGARAECKRPHAEPIRLFADATLSNFDLPEELRFELIAAAPKPNLTITAGRHDPWGRDFVAGELAFDYGGSVIAADLASQNVYRKGERRVIRRDRQAEEAAITGVAA